MVINGNGNYKYYFEERLREKGTYTDGLPSGEWTIYDKNGKFVKQFIAN